LARRPFACLRYGCHGRHPRHPHPRTPRRLSIRKPVATANAAFVTVD
jgi:hypothetical protein